MSSTSKNWWNVEKARDDKSRLEAITLFLKDVYNILNKGITPTDHLRGAVYSVTFSSVNSDIRINHGLDFIPNNFLLIHQSAPLGVYAGSTQNSQQFAFLRAGVTIGNAKVFLF